MKTSRLCLLQLSLVVVALVAPDASAGPPAGDKLTRVWRADADLLSVSFINAQTGWAVGDRGAILHTPDGGSNWIAQESGVDCRLQSVHFIDALQGWAAGGYYDEYVHHSRGVVLRTVDGGATWQIENAGLLPALRELRMTSAHDGWAAGDWSGFFQSALFFTRDGGRTWNPAPGGTPRDVVAADVTAIGAGAMAHADGRLIPIEHRAPQATPVAESGPQIIRRLKIRADGTGIAVGDGGLVRRTADGGASWQPPAADLSTGAGAQCDWRALAAQGPHVWIAGAPGSIVIHSGDGGRSWESFATGQSLPIHDLAFVDEQHGFAVGALGTLLKTTDGGRSWKPLGFAPQRAALWACFGGATDVPAETIVETSADDGYVSVATLLGRRESLDDANSAAGRDRMSDGLRRFGMSSVEQAWSFPLPPDALQLEASKVLETWARTVDGDAATRAEAYLVRQLRTWRPDVVLTHAPAPRGDAATDHLLHQLVLRAINSAADPQKFPEQIEMLNLEPWQAKKCFAFDRRAVQGSIVVKTGQISSRLASTPADFADRGRSLLYDRRVTPAAVQALRLLVNRTPHPSADRELFTGLTLAGGGEARRRSINLDGESVLQMRKAAERQRNLQAVIMQKSGTAGEALVGQLRDFVTGLDDAQAGRVLFQIAETFRAAGRWEAARETYEYLVTRLPQHPDADAAVARLLHYLAGGEADHRLRRSLLETAAGGVAAAAMIGPDVTGSQVDTLAQNVGSPDGAVPARGTTLAATPSPSSLIGYTGDENRRRLAVAIGAYLERRDPAGFSDPTALFPLASARHRLGQTAEAEGIFEAFTRSRSEDAWRRCADGELALRSQAAATVKPAHRSFAVPEKPLLDGVLDDAAWREVAPLELRGDAREPSSLPADGGSQVFIAHDSEYLYFAVRCRRAPGAAAAKPTGVRERDADLSSFDRVDLCLDVDRDFATYYRLTVDCRGWTSESCWDDVSWNPQWFVAAGGDDTWWTVEAAVPWSELAATPPAGGTAWALGLRRIAPTAGRQSWGDAPSSAIRPENFGYLIFD